MTSPPHPVAALLLDLDGTLVLSERVHRLTWQHFFTAWGMQVDDREYARTFMGRRASDVLAAVPGPWTGSDLRAVAAEMTAHAQTLGHAVEGVPGAADLITAAADAGVPVAVVTSAAPGWAEHVLGPVLGVRERVRVLVTAADVVTGKPAPEGYLLACRLLDVDPRCCAGLEDSPSGVRALAAAGVGTIVGVTTTSPAAELRAAGAGRVVAHLRDRWLLQLVTDAV